jgi:hypothetical protein
VLNELSAEFGLDELLALPRAGSGMARTVSLELTLEKIMLTFLQASVERISFWILDTNDFNS